MKSTYPQRIFKLVELAIVLGHHVLHFRAFVARCIVSSFVSETEFSSQAVNLVLVRLEPDSDVRTVLSLMICKISATDRFHSVNIESRAVSLSDHIRQFQVLCLDIPLHSLHSVDSLLSRVGLKLHLLELAQHVEMLCPKLRVKFGEGFVLVSPESDLVLKLFDQFVLGRYLARNVVPYCA